MTFAFAALFGVDLFDSSAYHKFARRGSLLFPEGTLAIDELRDPVCRCFLCAEEPLTEVARLSGTERERRIAYHNLLVSMEEIGRVRHAIREGTLWELAERRATAHPALRAGLAEARRHVEVFLPTEPESRRSFREISSESRERPSVRRFLDRVAVYRAGRPEARPVPRIALRPEYLDHIPLRDRSDGPLEWVAATPLGAVPLELCELYPVGPYLGIEEFMEVRRHQPPASVRERLEAAWGNLADFGRSWSSEWTEHQVRGLIEWQYGPEVAERLGPSLDGERSRRTGRLRTLRSAGEMLFHVGTDGVPRPTFLGAEALLRVLSPGRWRVVVAEDAVPFVREGRSLFARFVVDSVPALRPGSSPLLVDRSDRLIAVGRLLLAPHEIPRFSRGVAARVTAHSGRPERSEDDEGSAGHLES